MEVKFFVYSKQDGRIFLALPSLPENDFQKEDRVIFNKMVVARGINWDNSDWEYTENAINMNSDVSRYIYNPDTHEITEDLNWEEEI